MSYSISKVEAIRLSNLQIKTLFVIFVSENKLDSVLDCCQKKKPFQMSGYSEPFIMAGRLSDDCIILHLPRQIPICSLLMNCTRFGPHSFAKLSYAWIRLGESLYYQRSSSLAISTMFMLFQSQALLTMRCEVYFIDQSTL